MVTFPVTLALDYGRQRVGVAVSRGTLAEPLTVLTNDAELVPELRKVVAEENVQQLVVGVSEGAMAEESRAFGQTIAQTLNLPVSFADETLSSRQVHAKLAEGHAKRSVRRGAIDHLAAAEFLQEWLDQRAILNARQNGL